MIKISSWISATSFVAWVIFLGLIIEPDLNAKWNHIFIASVGVLIGSFLLSYLSAHIIKGNKGAIRLGILFSTTWVVIIFLIIEPADYSNSRIIYNNWIEFFQFGIVPIFSYWMVLWVVSGFLLNREKIED